MRTGGVFPKRHIASGLLHRKPAGISGSVAGRAAGRAYLSTITSWDATKRRMKKSSPKSCRHYGKRPLYPKLSAALQTAGSWSLRQRMGIPASSGLMKTGSMAPAEHPMCFPATRRFGIWRGKSRKHIQSTGKRWSKKGTSQNQAFLTCIQLRLCKQGMPGLFIPIFQTQGTRI